jgi:hypothetical protein
MLQVAEALDPFKTVPISMSNIYKVVDNLHMLWMCIYIHIFNVMMTFAMAKQFVPRVLTWVPLELQSAVLCCVCGFRGIQNDSRINVKHIYKVVNNLHMLWI